MKESTSITSPPGGGPGTRLPRAAQDLAEHVVELADVPERKRPQERAERRRRHRPMPKHRVNPGRAPDIAVTDAVRAEQHRVNQREHLGPGRDAPGRPPGARSRQRAPPAPAVARA
jgi:hypothetical protein